MKERTESGVGVSRRGQSWEERTLRHFYADRKQPWKSQANGYLQRQTRKIQTTLFKVNVFVCFHACLCTCLVSVCMHLLVHLFVYLSSVCVCLRACVCGRACVCVCVRIVPFEFDTCVLEPRGLLD